MSARPYLFLAAGSAFLASAAHAQDPRFAELHRMLPHAGVEPTDLVIGDVDEDGSPDLVVVGHGRDRLFLSLGVARFALATTPLLTAKKAVAAVLGDVDGDGHLDLFRAVDGDPHVLALGDGAGGFTSMPFPAGDTLAAHDAALGDVDGDGNLDAVIVGFPDAGLGGRTQLYLGDGAGGFVDATAQMPPHQDTTYSVVLADLDADGDLDTLIGNGPDGVAFNRLYANQGGGVFSEAAGALPADIWRTNDFAVADVDTDGDVDVYCANGPIVDSSRLWTNDGFATFADASWGLPPIQHGVMSAAFVDADGDGVLDLAVGGTSYPDLGISASLLLGDGAGAFSLSTGMPVLPPLHALAAADLDADGDPDLAVATADRVALVLGGTSGAFAVADPELPAVEAAAAILLADLDGDGFTDALLGRRKGTSGPNALFLNAPDALGGIGGWFVDASAKLPSYVGSAWCGALGDVDGDGDVDAYWGGASHDRLELNDGAAGFADASAQVPALGAITRDVVLADLDGDGDLDACLGRMPSDVSAPTDGANAALRNDGSGVFSAIPGAFPTLFEITVAFALGDVDADGDLDAFTSNYPQIFAPGYDLIYANAGDGTFSGLPGALPYTGTAGAFGPPVFADFDADGAIELFLGGGLGTIPDRFFQSAGPGVFVEASAGLPASAAGTSKAFAADVDEDGKLDLVLYDGDRLAALLGDGAGAFTEDAPIAMPDGLYGQVGIGDLDGDDDLDLWLGGEDGNVLFSNLDRNLAWRALPRVGKELVADVRGPALSPWVAAHSLATAHVALPPFGTLYLDPAHMPLLGFGVLDAAGAAQLAFAIPANPALVGVKVFAQAAVGPLPRLANADVAAFTDL